MLSLRSVRIFLGRFNWNLSIRHVNSPHKKPKFHKMQIVPLGQNMEIQQSMSTIHHRQQSKKGLDGLRSTKKTKGNALKSFRDNFEEIIREGPTSEVIENRLQGINLYAQRVNRVLERDIQEILNALEITEDPKSEHFLYVLRHCGSSLSDIPASRRHIKYVKPLWKIAKSRQISLDINHYNALLKCYVENNHKFSVTEFLENMSKDGLMANRVTYQYLIQNYCNDGQVDKAISILEYMKEAGSPINEHVFESLIYGYSLLGEMEKADELIEVMSELNLEPNHLIYTAKMRGMIKYGHDLFAITEELDQCIEKGIFFDDTDYFSLIIAFCEKRKIGAARTLCDYLPRRTGYFQVYRNHAPRMVFCGYPDLALELWTHHEASQRHEKKKGFDLKKENGLFLFRCMIHAEMKPEKIVKFLEESDKPFDSIIQCCSRLVDVYIRDEDFKTGTEFIQIAKEKFGDEFLHDELFRVHWTTLVIRTVRTTDKTIDLLINIIKMGLPMPNAWLREAFMWTIIRNSQLPVLSITLYMLKKIEEAELTSQLSRTRLLSCIITEALKQNSPQRFKEIAFCYAVYPGTYSPEVWASSLARNYYMTKDMDSFIGIIFFDSPMSLMTMPDHNGISRRPSIEHDENVFQSLIDLHAIVHKEESNTNPDTVVDEVLQVLEQLKLGISQKYVELLSVSVKDEKVLNRLKVLKKNYYNLDNGWSDDEKRTFRHYMKGRIYNACKTREPDARYNATYKGLHRSLSTDDQLGAYVYKMIERVKDGRTNKNGETGVDLSLVSQLLISYATQGKREEMEMIIQKTRNLNSYQHFNAQPVAVSTLVAKLFDHNIEHFCEFPFSKYRFEPPYMYFQFVINTLSEACQRGEYDEVIKVLQFVKNQKNFFSGQNDHGSSHAKMFGVLKYLYSNIQDQEKFEIIFNLIKSILEDTPHYNLTKSEFEGLKMINHVARLDLHGAVDMYENFAISHRKMLPLAKLLIKEIVIAENVELLAKVINITIDFLGKEKTLYWICPICIEVGRPNSAQKLIKALGGLNYNQAEINHQYSEYKNGVQDDLKLQKFKIFIDFCLNLPGANAEHLYGILIEVMSKNPDEISDLWIQMKEKKYKPSENQVKIMTDILDENKMEIPIVVL